MARPAPGPQAGAGDGLPLVQDPLRPFGLYEQGLLAFWQGTDEEARSLLDLSMVERQLGNLKRAEQLAIEALEIGQQRGDEWMVPYCLNGLAAVAAETGAFERAATLLGAAEALQARRATPGPPDDAPHFERSRAAVTAARVLVDRIWPRGPTKDKGRPRPVAQAGRPSTELRKRCLPT